MRIKKHNTDMNINKAPDQILRKSSVSIKKAVINGNVSNVRKASNRISPRHSGEDPKQSNDRVKKSPKSDKAPNREEENQTEHANKKYSYDAYRRGRVSHAKSKYKTSTGRRKKQSKKVLTEEDYVHGLSRREWKQYDSLTQNQKKSRFQKAQKDNYREMLSKKERKKFDSMSSTKQNSVLRREERKLNNAERNYKRSKRKAKHEKTRNRMSKTYGYAKMLGDEDVVAAAAEKSKQHAVAQIREKGVNVTKKAGRWIIKKIAVALKFLMGKILAIAGAIFAALLPVIVVVLLVLVLIMGVASIFSSSSSAAGNVSGVPLYLQTDSRWGSLPIMGGTISSSGCSITCVAMVASYFNQTAILPSDVQEWTWDNGNNAYYVSPIGASYSLYGAAAEKYDLQMTDLGNDITSVMRELIQGSIVIASATGTAESPGTFTSGGHLIVLRGLDADGNILVNDPNDSSVKNHYSQSFSPALIARECKQYWSFWKEGFEPANFEYSDNDLYLLAKLIQCEAGSDWCTDLHQQLVASVIINRVSHSSYPDTISDVIFDSGQYACTTDGSWSRNEPSERAYKNALYALSCGGVAPSNVIYQANFKQGNGVYAVFENPTVSGGTYKYTYICY